MGHRLPGIPPSNPTDKPRWTIVRLHDQRLRNAILKSKSMLKGSGIRIYEDLSPGNRTLLKKLDEHKDIASRWSDMGKIFGKTAHNVVKEFKVTDNIAEVVRDMLLQPAREPKPRPKPHATATNKPETV